MVRPAVIMTAVFSIIGTIQLYNEPAILRLLKHALTEARYQVEQLEQVVQEHPNAYDHAANCEIEATVKQVTGIIRTNKFEVD